MCPRPLRQLRSFSAQLALIWLSLPPPHWGTALTLLPSPPAAAAEPPRTSPVLSPVAAIGTITGLTCMPSVRSLLPICRKSVMSLSHSLDDLFLGRFCREMPDSSLPPRTLHAKTLNQAVHSMCAPSVMPGERISATRSSILPISLIWMLPGAI